MKITMSTSRRSASHWAPLILRAIVGYGFMAHGYAKLARGPQVFSVTLEALGVPIPHILAWQLYWSNCLAVWRCSSGLS